MKEQSDRGWEGREGGREGRREGGREGGMEGGMEGGREGGREGRREGGREGGRENGKVKEQSDRGWEGVGEAEERGTVSLAGRALSWLLFRTRPFRTEANY